MDNKYVLCTEEYQSGSCPHSEGHVFGLASKTVCAMKLPYTVTPNDLYPIFSPFGLIEFIAVIPSCRNGSCISTRIFAFIVFYQEEIARAAAKDEKFIMNGAWYKCALSHSDYSIQRYKPDQKRLMEKTEKQENGPLESSR